MTKYRKPKHDVAEETKSLYKHGKQMVVESATTHRDTTITVLLVVALLVLGAIVYQRYQANKVEKAWAALSAPLSPEQLRAEVEEYGNTPAGPFLKLRYADALLNTGNEAEVDTAIGIYRELAASGAPLFARRAEYSIAMALESAGKFDESKAQLAAVVQAGDPFWSARAEEALNSMPQRQAAYTTFASAKKKAEEDAKVMEMLREFAATSTDSAVREFFDTATPSGTTVPADVSPAEIAANAPVEAPVETSAPTEAITEDKPVAPESGNEAAAVETNQ